MDERPQNARELGRLWALGQVGLEMVVPVGVGYWLDCRFDWLPWGTVTGAVVGFAVGMTHMLVLLNREK